MPQDEADTPPTRTIEHLSPLTDLRSRGLANLLARQQEEYDSYPKIANETPPIYQLRLRAARQAARNVIPSTRDDRSNWPAMWIAIAVVSILLFIKLKFG